MVKSIKVWLPGAYKNIPTEYQNVTDFHELPDGGLSITLDNGARFRYHRLPYVIELEPVKE